MDRLRLFTASCAACCLSLVPVLTFADDELEVTMEVIDDLDDIDGEIVRMRGPEADRDEDLDGIEEDEFDTDDEVSEEDFADDFEEGFEDGFEHDDEIDDAQDDFESDEDLEEGEDIDDDQFDELDDEMDDMEDEERTDNVIE